MSNSRMVALAASSASITILAILVWAGAGSTSSPGGTTAELDGYDLRENTLFIIPPPLTLTERAETAELVVVARLTASTPGLVVYPDGYDPASVPAGELQHPGFPFGGFQVEVVEYLKGSGPTTLRLLLSGEYKTTTRGSLTFPMPPMDRPVLLFLIRSDVQRNTWQSWDGWGLWFEEDAKVRYNYRADEERPGEARPVAYLDGMDFAGAVAATRAAVEAAPLGPPKPVRWHLYPICGGPPDQRAEGAPVGSGASACIPPENVGKPTGR